MFTDYQLSNFSRYLRETPKHMLGIDPGPVFGAYDSAFGARAHGFRRGINMRQFARGGAFDAGGNLDPENPNMSKSGNCLVALEKYLSQKLSTEEMQKISPMIETLCHHVKSEAMNGEDDDPDADAEAMDKPRRARDDPDFPGATRTGADPRFNSLVRNNKGSAMDSPASSHKGRRRFLQRDVQSFAVEARLIQRGVSFGPARHGAALVYLERGIPMGKIQSLVAVARGGGNHVDQDRLALNIAINAAAEARRAVDNAAAARGRALRMVDQADDRLSAATTAVTEAKDSLARRMTSYATEGGTALAPDSILSNCRAEERDAADNLDAARAALNAVEATLEGPLEALKASERRVGELARGILARAIEPTIADIVRLKASLRDAMGQLSVMARECCVQWPPNAELSRLTNHLRIEARGGICFELDHAGNPGVERMQAYLAALLLDADASI
jgi:hypothetical protein